MIVCRLDIGELLAACAGDIDDRVGDGLADFGRLVSGRSELFRRGREVFRRLGDVAHELANLFIHILHGMCHRADLVGACGQFIEFGRILLAQREVARADDLHALRDFLNRPCDLAAEIARERDEDELQDDHDAKRRQNLRTKFRIVDLRAGCDRRVNIINPDARADDPVKRLEKHGVVALRQRLRFARLCKLQIRKAAALLQAVLDHFLDEVDAIRVNEVDAALALDIAAEQDDVDALFRVNPEIAFAIVIAQVAHAVGGFFLCLLDRHLARLRPLVVFIENADSHLRLFLELRFDIRFEILTVARNVRFIVPDILKDEEAADQDGRGQRNAADRHDQPCFHG